MYKLINFMVFVCVTFIQQAQAAQPFYSREGVGQVALLAGLTRASGTGNPLPGRRPGLLRSK